MNTNPTALVQGPWLLLLLGLAHRAAGGAVTNGLVDTDFNQECFYNKTVDILLLLDGSGSVGDNTFASQIEFAVLFARKLNISEDGTHLGIVQYADEARVEVPLHDYTSSSQLEPAIHRIPFLGGATHTGRALDFVRTDAFAGARGGDVPKVLVVLTDGQSQDDAVKPSQTLRESDVTIYSVGITNLVNVHELHEIAGNAARTFTVESLEELDRPLVESITLDMCKTDFRPGEPEIICGPDHIGIRAATKDPFDGFVFIQDHFHDEECRKGAMDFDDPKMISLDIPFSKCNVHRYRSIDPRGIYVEATIVFMFHMTFMTKVDHMVKVQCFYMEADKTVSSPMEVSMISTEFREQMYEMPTCYYTLRKGSPDGPELDYASLGDSVYHRWECIDRKGYDTFGMLVHSCYVDNGFGDKVDVLDAKGCGLDPILLQTPDYHESLRLATKPYMVFKYADRPVLQFQCQITLCIKYDNGCSGITPPVCPILMPHQQLRRRRDNSSATGPLKPIAPHRTARILELKDEELNDIRAAALLEESGRRLATLDVFTNSVTVFEKAPTCEGSSTQAQGGLLDWIHPIHLALLTSLNMLIAMATVFLWIVIVRGRSSRSARLPSP